MEQRTEGDIGKLDAQAQEGQGGLGADGADDAEDELDDKQRADVGNDVADDRLETGNAHVVRGADVILFTHRERQRPDDAGLIHPTERDEHDDEQAPVAARVGDHAFSTLPPHSAAPAPTSAEMTSVKSETRMAMVSERPRPWTTCA